MEPSGILNSKTDEIKFWDIISGMALAGSNKLRGMLGLDELNFRKLSPAATNKARDYYIYRVLDEVQKAGCSLMHWGEFISKEHVDPPRTEVEEQIRRLVVEEQIDYQHMRSRKLVEVLVELILFSTTDKEVYFKDYFLIRELNEHNESQADRREYYAHESENYKATASDLYRQIEGLAVQGLDPAQRWYLENPGPQKQSWITKTVKLSSFRKRYSDVLKFLDDGEFIAIGKSYKHAYGMSKDLHFTSNDTSSSFSHDDIKKGIGRCTLLIPLILLRCAKMLGIDNDPTFKQMADMVKLSDGQKKWVQDVKAPALQIGDYVRDIYGNVCRVTNTNMSKYGLHSFEIEYLNAPPIPKLLRDWAAAFELSLIVKKSDVLIQASSDLSQSGVSGLTNEEISENLDSRVRNFCQLVK